MSDKITVSIRRATPLDTVNLVRLLKECWDELREIQVSRVDDYYAISHVNETVQKGFVLVADVSGRLVGSIAVRPCREEWSRPTDWYLNEVWWYTTPRFRDRGVALQLLLEAEKLSDDKQLPLYMCLNSLNPEVDTLFTARSSYRRTGGNFMRFPRNGQQEVTDVNHHNHAA